MTVAVDLRGGDGGPAVVTEGAAAALAADPALSLVLVGLPSDAEAAGVVALRERTGSRVSFATATQVVGMDEDPARGVRRKRDATVRVAARSVRDGEAEALVSCGSTGAVLAAAVFTLGRLPGVLRPSLAALVPGLRGRLVYLDAGATVAVEPELLVASALLGTAYATTSLGVPCPRVALLSTGAEQGKGDAARREGAEAVAAALEHVDAVFVGLVEGGDVPYGRGADVVVVDGFTGNVLVKGLEGLWAAVGEAVADEVCVPGTPAPVAEAARELVGRALARLDPTTTGGGLLLGVPGVVVVGHGSSDATSVAAAVGTAAAAVRDDLVGRTAGWFADRTRRRTGAAPAGAAASPVTPAAPSPVAPVAPVTPVAPGVAAGGSGR